MDQYNADRVREWLRQEGWVVPFHSHIDFPFDIAANPVMIVEIGPTSCCFSNSLGQPMFTLTDPIAIEAVIRCAEGSNSQRNEPLVKVEDRKITT